MSESLSEDYNTFIKEIQKGISNIFKIDGDLEIVFKKHHKSTYAIALVLSKLKQVSTNENQVIYLAEILSDLLTISKLAPLGFEMPCLIVMRRLMKIFTIISIITTIMLNINI